MEIRIQTVTTDRQHSPQLGQRVRENGNLSQGKTRHNQVERAGRKRQ